jgi:hypothetical protein
MEKEQDYLNDITAIRSMMERSSKFLSLSGWAGIMAGLYALIGTYIAHTFFRFKPAAILEQTDTATLSPVIVMACIILMLAVGTAIVLSYKRATKRAERIWNITSRRLLTNMAIPLVTGGVLLLECLSAGFTGLLVPLTMLFYGLALCSAGNFTYKEVRYLGMIVIGLGLLSTCFIEYSLLIWAVGFGVMHIVYGTYIYIQYER